MTQHIKNRDVFLKDPLENRLVNQGVAEVAEPGSDQEIRTLRHELETFVCEGQYARGLERILSTYLASLDREEQPAVWVSGFYGSGKSHLVKMLRFLWTDYRFPDGATARGLAHLPDDIQAHLRELSTQGKRLGGLHAAGGKLGAGAGGSVRLALLGLLFRSADLPEDYAAARFVLFLKRNGFLEGVKTAVEAEGRPFDRELKDLYVSPVLARALLAVHPTFAPSEDAVLSQIAAQFERPGDISDADMTTAIEEALGAGSKLPATLIVLDEVQQYIGETSTERAYQVQEVAEACSKRFGSRILFVGTGQTAITGTPQLQKLQARFKLPIELSDADVDTVVRKIVLAKKPDKEALLRQRLAECSGEISRHLPGTRLAPRPEDDEVLVADYPLLPARRRFWELALRAIDPTGTKAELRNQLTNVFEAVLATAGKDLLNVVPADFLYHQNKTQMVQSGALLREIQEVIERLDDQSDAGLLKSRLCALCFLIGKLDREAGADSGLRATPDMLADLLVEDLAEGSSTLRRLRIPPLLEELAETGTLIQVGEEYRLQTRESAAWDQDYRTRLSRLQNDTPGLAIERADLLRARVGEALKGVKLLQGQSKVQRKLHLHFGQDKPSTGGPDVPVWVRDGWNDDEKSVQADARKEGPESPLVIVFLPEHATGDLKKHLASAKAARETLSAKGQPGTDEGIEARKGMETRQRAAEQQRDALLGEVLANARVILAGSGEESGASLIEKVRGAAGDALLRLYYRFGHADHGHWNKVIERAQKGATDALTVVGFTGDPEKHPVCHALLDFVSGGKKGREVRKNFEAPPYGWPQDAIDGALILLVATGHLRAAQDGRVLSHKQLDQKNLGVTDVRRESATVTTPQKIALRRLFQEAGIQAVADAEVIAARDYLQALKALAARAGGDAPLPSPPNSPRLGELAGLAGNEQLVALFDARDELSAWRAEWSRRADLIAKRYPRWQALERLAMHAQALPVATEVAPQIDALRKNRALLNEPDPVPPLLGRLVQALREALQEERSAYAILHQQEKDRLAATDTWTRLTPEQQADILNRQDVAGVREVHVGTEPELLASLAETSLDYWATRRDALPQRFAKALEEAARLLEPKAVRVSLPSATIHDGDELKNWLTKVESTVREKLGNGPVIV
jgi:hypothetical protein